MRPCQISQRDIARQLGVSHATVSLALRNHPRISPRRKAQIKRLAEEMGYRPEPMLHALHSYRKQRTPCPPPTPGIAWLDFWGKSARHAHPEIASYRRGAREIVEKWGFRIDELRVGRNLPIDRLETELRARGTTGLLIPPLPNRDVLALDRWNWRAFSIVRFGLTIPELPVHGVTCDQTAAAVLAYHRAQALGYPRVGLVMTDYAIETTLFSAGFLCAQHESPESSRIPILTLPASRRNSSASRLEAWIKRFMPDAIVTGIPEVRDCLESIGMRVPQDIGLATLNRLDDPTAAGIDQHPEEVGRVAAETLISLINGAHRGSTAQHCTVLISGQWRDGLTLPARHPRGA